MLVIWGEKGRGGSLPTPLIRIREFCGDGGVRVPLLNTKLLRAGYRRRARPLDGAEESTPPITRNLDRTSSENSEKVQVPYRTVKRQYFCHVVQGYLPIFKIPRFPRGDLPSLHTLDGTRTERAA